MAGKKRLFGEVDSEDGDGDLDLTVNEEFAKRLEHNKTREELHRLEEKHKARQKGKQAVRPLLKDGPRAVEAGDESSSSSSSDDEEELDVAAELQDPKFLKVLSGVRRGEIESHKSEEASDLESDDESEEQPTKKKQKKEKPILLKDVARGLAETLHDSSSQDELDSEDEDGQHAFASTTYNQDLDGARRDLLQAARAGESGEEEEEELFGVSRPGTDVHASQSQPTAKRKLDSQQMLDDYFGKDTDLNADDLFLKRFILNKGQAEGEEDDKSDEELDEEEDERHLEAADKFEAEHNFRFEEPGAERLHTYPRKIEGAVRQGNTVRAEARQRKQERKQQERAKQEAEIQRLKTLKRREIEARMAELQETAGLHTTDEGLLGLLQKEDFNEEEYDQAMAKAFGEEYYEEGEDDAELEGKDEDDMPEQDGPVSAGGFRAVQQDIASTLRDAGRERDAEEVQRLLDEYSKLEYEDIVAGMPTRFRYQQVASGDFGLSTGDILGLTDKELNQVVGLRRLAPYREERSSKKGDRFAARQLHAIRNQPHEGKKKSAKLADANTTQAQEEHRKATYERPTLVSAKPREKAGKRKGTAVVTSGAVNVEKLKTVKPLLADVDTSTLSKTQKKNLRRSLKRKAANAGDA